MNKQSLMNLIRTAALAAMAAIPGMCCSYSVSVPTIGAGGGVVPVYVSTQAGCAWEISAGGNFLSYYGGRTGTGPGVAYLYAAPDSKAARSATVNVLQPYTYACGLGTRSTVLCTGYTTAGATTAVQQ
jgi:hypothetical protein